MDELFRFVALRSAQQADPSRVIELKLSPELRDRLGAKHGSPQAVSLLVSAARAFASSDRFVAKSSSLTLHRQLGAFNDKVGQEPTANLATLQRHIADIFNLKPAALVASPDFLKDQERIADTIGAAWLDPGELCELIEQLAQFARLMSLAERVAAGDVSLDVPGAIQDALGRILVLPDALVPAMILPTAAEPPSSGNQLSAGINSSLVPLMPSRADQIADAVAIDATIDALLSQPPQAYATAVNDKIIAYGAPLVLTPESIAALDPTARTVLQKFLLDVSGSPPADGKAWRSPSVPEGVQILELALSDALAAIPPVSLTTDLTVTNDATSNASSVPPRLPSPVCHPSTDATIQAVGIGDLLVVRQTLTRYEPEEISYVENVLKTEKKERTTVRTTTTDQTFVTETETTTEEERDLQSTERYDLKRETEATSKEDFSVKGGVAATYRYGTVLEIKANVDLASSTSKQDSTKIATDYGKDVTARSASKITQRVRQQQTLRTIEMFQETDVPGVDNMAGKGHVIGVYQWLNKIYSAQVFNYGKRVLFDLVIPEPAAFWIAAVISRRPEVSGLVKPPAWTLRPDELNIANYQDYVTIYDVPGVDPPPKRTLVVSKAYGSGAAGAESAGKQDNSQSDAGARFVVSDNLAIPDGYQAVWGRAQGAVSPGLLSQPIISKGSLPILFSGQMLALLGLGKFGWTVDAPENPKVVFEDLTGGFLLNGEEGVLPVSITASNVVSFQLNVEVECPRTDHAYQQWQLKTHAAITQAYLKLQGDYEDKLAQLAQQQDPQFAGGNPDMN